MRYKNNVLDRITNVEATINRAVIQVNRGSSQDEILDTLEKLKELTEGIRRMVSVEPDDFEQQFANR